MVINTPSKTATQGLKTDLMNAYT